MPFKSLASEIDHYLRYQGNCELKNKLALFNWNND